MASSFLRRKAQKQAERIDKEFGSTAYGGTKSKVGAAPTNTQSQSSTTKSTVTPVTTPSLTQSELNSALKSTNALQSVWKPTYGTSKIGTQISNTLTAQKAAKEAQQKAVLNAMITQGAKNKSSALAKTQMGNSGIADLSNKKWTEAVSSMSIKQLEKKNEELQQKAAEADPILNPEEYDKIAAQGSTVSHQLETRRTEKYNKELSAARTALETVQNNTDFEKIVSKTKNQTPFSEHTVSVGGRAEIEDVVRDIQLLAQKEAGEQVSGIGYEAQNMTDEQRNVMLYYAGTEQWDKAREYLENITSELNAKKATKQTESAKTFAEAYPAAGAAANIASSFITPLAWIRTVAHNAKNNITGEWTPLDTNTNWFYGTRMSSATSEGVSKAAEDMPILGDIEINGKNLGSFVAETGLSIVQFISKIPLGGVGSLAYIGLGAAGETTADMLNSGASVSEASLIGTVAGGIEIATEKIGLDNLFEILGKTGKRGLVTVLRNAMKSGVSDTAINITSQVLSEASEEAISEIANNIVELAVLGDRSEFKQYIALLESRGKSHSEAEAIALKQFYVANVMWAAAGGALSGGIMGAGATAKTAITVNVFDASTGKTLKMSQSQYDLVQAGLNYYPTDSQSYQLASQIANSIEQRADAGVSSTQLGKLYRLMAEEKGSAIQQNPDAQGTVEQALHPDEKVLNQTAEKLIDLGDDPKKADAKAELLNRAFSGDTSLTDADLRKMDLSSESTRSLFLEMTGVELPTGVSQKKLISTARSAVQDIANDLANTQKRMAEQGKTLLEVERKMAEQAAQAEQNAQARTAEADSQAQTVLNNAVAQEEQARAAAAQGTTTDATAASTAAQVFGTPRTSSAAAARGTSSTGTTVQEIGTQSTGRGATTTSTAAQVLGTPRTSKAAAARGTSSTGTSAQTTTGARSTRTGVRGSSTQTTTQTGATQTGAAQTGATKTGATQTGATQTGATQATTGPRANVRMSDGSTVSREGFISSYMEAHPDVSADVAQAKYEDAVLLNSLGQAYPSTNITAQNGGATGTTKGTTEKSKTKGTKKTSAKTTQNAQKGSKSAGTSTDTKTRSKRNTGSQARNSVDTDVQTDVKTDVKTDAKTTKHTPTKAQEWTVKNINYVLQHRKGGPTVVLDYDMARAENGYFDEDNNTIHINAYKLGDRTYKGTKLTNQQAIVYILGHELTHAADARDGGVLVNQIMDYAEKTYGGERVDQVLAETRKTYIDFYVKQKGMSQTKAEAMCKPDFIRQEVAADVMRGVLLDSGGIYRLARENSFLLGKARDLAETMAKRLSALTRGTTEQAVAAQAQYNELTFLVETMDRGLREVKYSDIIKEKSTNKTNKEAAKNDNKRGSNEVRGDMGQQQRSDNRGRKNAAAASGKKSERSVGNVGRSDTGLRGSGDLGGNASQLIPKWTRARMNKKGIPDVGLAETTDRNAFSDALDKAKAANRNGAMVDPQKPESLKDSGARMFMREDGNAGVAVEADGNIVGVFKNPDLTTRGVVKDLLLTAIAQGGNHLDCYATYGVNDLRSKYAKLGFEPVAWLEFSREAAADDWDYDNLGTPDVVLWVHNGDSVGQVIAKSDNYNTYTEEDIHALPKFSDYDKAKEYQKAQLELKKKQAEQAKQAAKNTKQNTTQKKTTKPTTSKKTTKPGTKKTTGKKTTSSQNKSKSGSRRFSIDGKELADPLYSQMERVIDDYKGDKIGASSLVSYLRGHGVKAEEIRWSGVEQFLEGKKSVTKNELFEFLRANELVIKDVERSERAARNAELSATEDEELEQAGQELRDNMSKIKTLIEQIGDSELSELWQAATKDEFITAGAPDTESWEWEEFDDKIWEKLSDEPSDSEQYRSLEALSELVADAELIVEESDLVWSDKVSRAEPKYQAYARNRWGAQNYREILFRLPQVGKGLISPHWEQNDVLAHTRLQDEVDAEGKKVLFVDEVQSDWHQKGRDVGYAPETWGGVPEAPYKDTWHEYVLKRILRMAAEGGYDKIAWTTGKMQADRYNLGRQVGKIDILSAAGTGNYSFYVDNRSFVNKSPKEVTDLLGRDLGRRVMELADNTQAGETATLTGDDLVIGGEGMRNFYDVGGKSAQNIPKFLNKYLKPWGVKVQRSLIGGDLRDSGEYQEGGLENVMRIAEGGLGNDDYVIVPSVDITNDMRYDLLYKGQPRYSIDGAELADPLYSQMERVIDDYKGDKIGASSLVSYLRGHGVKAEEIRWSGVEQFLEGKKSVTKNELFEFLRANELVIKDVERSSQAERNYALSDEDLAKVEQAEQQIRDMIPKFGDLIEQAGSKRLSKLWSKITSNGELDQEALEKLNDAVDEAMHSREYNFQDRSPSLETFEDIIRRNNYFGFGSSHIIDGGPALMNYPLNYIDQVENEDDRKFLQEWAKKKDRYNKNLREWHDSDQYRKLCGIQGLIWTGLDLADTGRKLYEKGKRFAGPKYQIYARNRYEAQNYREVLFRLPQIGNGLKSPHWEQNDVLAHTRLQDEVDAEGKKVLFVDEVQSDWHQKGRDEGYAPETWGGVPEAPYKDTWHEYVLKRILRMAAEGGYDKIAWTTGQMQAARYNLGQYVDEIYIINNENGTYTLTVDDEFYSNQSPKDVTDLLGQDLGHRAMELADNTPSNETGEMAKLTGDDLVIGGEGMRNFYDIGGKSAQNIPKFLNKYLKPWGVKVQSSLIGGDLRNTGAYQDGGLEKVMNIAKTGLSNDRHVIVPSVDITEDMRNDLLYKGQPRYSIDNSGMDGYIDEDRIREIANTPEFKRWFHDPTGMLTDENGLPKLFLHGSPTSGTTSFRDRLEANSGGFFYSEDLETAEHYGMRPSKGNSHLPVQEFTPRIVKNWGEAQQFVEESLRDNVKLKKVGDQWVLSTRREHDYINDIWETHRLTRNGLEEFNSELGYEIGDGEELESWEDLDDFLARHGRGKYEATVETMGAPTPSGKADFVIIWDAHEGDFKWHKYNTYKDNEEGLKRFNAEYGDAIRKNNVVNPGYTRTFLTSNKTLVVDAEGRRWDNVDGHGQTTDGLVAQAWDDGYDMVIIKNVHDGKPPSHMGFDENGKETWISNTITDYIIKDSGQAKSPYNIGTYDRENSDWRYSIDNSGMDGYIDEDRIREISETDEFEAWFHDPTGGRLTDENGLPKLFLRGSPTSGTTSARDRYESNSAGEFYSEDLETAKHYGGRLSGRNSHLPVQEFTPRIVKNWDEAQQFVEESLRDNVSLDYNPDTGRWELYVREPSTNKSAESVNTIDGTYKKNAGGLAQFNAKYGDVFGAELDDWGHLDEFMEKNGGGYEATVETMDAPTPSGVADFVLVWDLSDADDDSGWHKYGEYKNSDAGISMFNADYGDAIRDYRVVNPGYSRMFLTAEKALIVDAEGRRWNNVDGHGQTTDELVDQAWLDGYDMVIIDNVRDGKPTGKYGFDENDKWTWLSDTITDYIIRDSGQAKSPYNFGTYDRQIDDRRYSIDNGGFDGGITKDQVREIASKKEFKRWFHDGKGELLDPATGLPLTLYHGTTRAGYTRFEDQGALGTGAFWFAKHSSTSAGYAGSWDDYAPEFKPLVMKNWDKVSNYLKAYYPMLSMVDGETDVEIQDTKTGKTLGFFSRDDDGIAAFNEQLQDMMEDSSFSLSDENSGIYQVFLSMKNPLIVECKGLGYSELTPSLTKDPRLQLLLRKERSKGERITADTYVDKVKLLNKSGQTNYDGIIFKNVCDGRQGSENGEPIDIPDNDYVVFDSSQIKSVYNEGSFDVGNKDIRYSVNSKDLFAKQVDTALNEDLRENSHHALYIRDTPNMLAEVGLGNLPLCVTAKHVKNMVHEKSPSNGSWHGLTVGLVKRLPELLSHPVMILDSYEKPGNVIAVLTGTDADNNPVIATIRPNVNADVDGKNVPANFVTSVYGKNNFENWIRINAENGKMLYWNKQKTQQLAEIAGFKISDSLTAIEPDTILRQHEGYNKDNIPTRRYSTDKKEGNKPKTGGNTGNVNPDTGYERGSVADSFARIWNTGDRQGALSMLEQAAKTLAQAQAEAAEQQRNETVSKVFRPKNTEDAITRNRRTIDELIKKYGAMAQTSGAQQEVHFPRQVDNKTKTAGFVQTAAAAKVTNEVVMNELEASILRGDAGITYTPVADKGTMDQIKEDLKTHGVESMQADWDAIVRTGKGTGKMGLISKLDIARAEQLYVEACNNKDVVRAQQLVAEIAAVGTQAGQTVQAMTLLKKMTPAGNLYYIQKAVDRLNKDQTGKHQDIIIDPKLAKELLNANSREEIDAAMDKLIQNLADQMPVTIADKWNAWRYLAMLGNARTHARNFLGNAVFVPARLAKDTIAQMMERALPKDQRTKGWGFTDTETLDFARQDALTMEDTLRGGGKYNPADMIRDKRRIFKLGALNKIEKFNSAALEAEDWVFLRAAYTHALAGYINARGLDVTTMSGKDSTREGRMQLNQARAYAVQEAQRATYRDASKLASRLNYLKRNSGKLGGVLLEGVLPFTKTPINILRRGVEYSPFGLAKGVAHMASKVRKGEMDASTAIDELAAGMTGTGIIGLGIWLSSLGMLTAGLGDDDEDEYEKLQGEQGYALRIGDTSYTIDWTAPVALPLFVGAAINDLTQDDHELSFDDIVDGVSTIAEPMLSLSMLDGLRDALTANKYDSEDKALYSIVASMTMSYASQGVPTLFGQISRTIDGSRRTTFTPKGMGTVESWLNREWQNSVQGKTPFYEENKMLYVDAWGRTDTESSIAARVFENFLSPGYVSKLNTTDVDEEITRLAKATGDNGVYPNKAQKYFNVNGKPYAMTQDEYQAHLIDRGQTSYKLVSNIINSKEYAEMTDTEKAKSVELAYEYAADLAKTHTTDTYTSGAKWMTSLTEYANMGGDAAEYLMLKATSDDSVLDAAYAKDDMDAGTLTQLVYMEIDSFPESFEDPYMDDYYYTMNDEQQTKYQETYREKLETGMYELVQDEEWQEADAEKRKELVSALKKTVTSETKTDMSDWLFYQDIYSEPKD